MKLKKLAYKYIIYNSEIFILVSMILSCAITKDFES